MRVPWTARRSNQSILKEISPEYSLEGLMLKLKLQFYNHLMWRTNSLEKNPDSGKDWRWQERGMTRVRGLDSITVAMDMSLSKLWVLVMDREARHAAVHGVTVRHDWVTELNWFLDSTDMHYPASYRHKVDTKIISSAVFISYQMLLWI